MADDVKRLQNLQILRFVAAFLVVIFHWSQILVSNGVLQKSFEIGNFGVDIFFVLSGFVMAYTTAAATTSPTSFFLKRLIRIVPLYWFLTLCLFSIAIVSPSLLGASNANVTELLKSLFFIPFEKSNGLFQPLLFLGWTLNYEMFFYMSFAIALLFPFSHILLTIGFVMFCLLLYMLGNNEGVWGFYANPIILEFVAGVMIWHIWKCYQGNVPAWASYGMIIAGIVLLVVLRSLLNFEVENRITYSLLPAMLILAGALFLPGVSGKLWAGMVLLGDASYSMYLVHPYIQKAISLPVDELGLVVSTFLSLLMITTVFGVSIALYIWIERAGNLFLRSVILKNRSS